MTAVCPDCTAPVDLPNDADINDIIFCEDCDADLEVVRLDPVELERVEEDYI